MSIQVDQQTTKKYDLPLSYLDYGYITDCKDVKKLEKILLVLRSGEEGRFPDLELHAEKRLEHVSPKSRVLRKDGPILRKGDIASGDWHNIEEDLSSWTKSMSENDSKKTVKKVMTAGAEHMMEVDENLPPVRSANVVLEGSKQKKAPGDKKTRRAMPRDHKEWDKFDIDAELAKADDVDQKPQVKRANMAGVTLDLDTQNLGEAQRKVKAEREKDKGNEAFRSHDYDESVAYYTRSISLCALPASYNNRALAYLKLEKWDQAIADCNTVLKIEKENIKALLRRGTAYKSKKDHKQASRDLGRVLELEPHNKKAQGLFDDIVKEKKTTGKRMVIEEVEESEDEAEVIEVEKPAEKIIEIEKPAAKIIELEKPAPAVNGIDSHKAAEKSNMTNDVGKKVSEKSKQKKKQKPQAASPKKESAPVEAKASVQAALTSKEKKAAYSEFSKLQDTTSHVSQAEPQSHGNTPSALANPISNSTSSSSPESQPPTGMWTRPVLTQTPLPAAVLPLKEEGNTLYRSGNYADAAAMYSKAVAKLEKDASQIVNLSTLLNNRAACHLKTGNCPAAAQDCCQALTLVPHSAKALLRRAAAYEALERYGAAYADYKHVISVDSSTQQAHQGAGRCQAMMVQRFGVSVWRSKLPPLTHVQPWEIPVIVDPSAPAPPAQQPLSPSPSQAAPATPTPATSPSMFEVPSPSKSASPGQKQQQQQQQQQQAKPTKVEPSKEEKFESLKAKGNAKVQKGEHADAASCYSECIKLRPDQVACYTNRALCYLKLNKNASAETDCSTALTLQPSNPKALYRRAVARRSQAKLKSALQDLVELLKLEPKNTAAQKEMDAVKLAYKEELEKMKQKKKAEEEVKPRRRVKIEEVDEDEDEEERPSRKAADKGKAPKSRASKTSHPAPQRSKVTAPSTPPTPPVAPPIAPRLMKTTPYEFCQAWNSLKPSQGVQPYAQILRQVAPSDLADVISNKLDGQMLQILVMCVHLEMVLKGEMDQGYQILDNLCKVPRFSTVSMFMSSKEKKDVATVLDILSQNSSSAYSSADVLRLKKLYSVKIS